MQFFGTQHSPDFPCAEHFYYISIMNTLEETNTYANQLTRLTQTYIAEIQNLLCEIVHLQSTTKSENNKTNTNSQNSGTSMILDISPQSRILEKMFGRFPETKYFIYSEFSTNKKILYKDRRFSIPVRIIDENKKLLCIQGIELRIQLYDSKPFPELKQYLEGQKQCTVDHGEVVFTRLKITQISSKIAGQKYTLIIYPTDKELLQTVRPLIIFNVEVKAKKTKTRCLHQSYSQS